MRRASTSSHQYLSDACCEASSLDAVQRPESANPDISVNFSYISRTDTDTVLPPRLRGDNPPDIKMTDMPLAEVWGDAGLLAPIDKGDWSVRWIAPPPVRRKLSEMVGLVIQDKTADLSRVAKPVFLQSMLSGGLKRWRSPKPICRTIASMVASAMPEAVHGPALYP